jgi:hypothetical protein
VKHTPNEASRGPAQRVRASAELELPARIHLIVQREISRLLSPVTLGLIWIVLRFVQRYRFERLAEIRREYRAIRARSDAPLLVCANHLTMVDSFLITCALGNPLWFSLNFSALPWNVPDRVNFAAKSWQRALIYILKSIPIQRGGRRSEATAVLNRLAYLLRKKQSALIFPEGGRSRSGRITVENAATGVGRVIRSVPDCRVLCVYLRGEQQSTWSLAPERGDRFYTALSEIEPKTDHSGLRGSRDLVQQVVRNLAEMESEYFDGR